MSTTNLFVELVVIGIGVVLWLGLLVGCACGTAWLRDLPTSMWTLPPLLALAYVLGIVADRLADSLLSHRKRQIRHRVIEAPTHEAVYREARLLVLSQGTSELVQLFEYGKSRIRIIRTWVLLLFLLAITSIPFSLRETAKFVPLKRALLTGGVFVFLVLLAIVSLWSWSRLVRNDCERVIEASRFLRGNGET